MMTRVRYAGLVLLGLFGFLCEAAILVALLPFSKGGRQFFAEVGTDLIDYFTDGDE